MRRHIKKIVIAAAAFVLLTADIGTVLAVETSESIGINESDNQPDSEKDMLVESDDPLVPQEESAIPENPVAPDEDTVDDSG